MNTRGAFSDPAGEFAVAVPEYIFYLLYQAARRRYAAMDGALASMNLTATRLRCLAIIGRIEGCTMNALAEFSAIDRTTLTREVDQFVADGLVTRSVPPRDRRRVNLTLTEGGEALLFQGLRVLAGFDRKSLDGLPPARQRLVARALQIVVRNLIDDETCAEDVIAFAQAKPDTSTAPAPRLDVGGARVRPTA